MKYILVTCFVILAAGFSFSAFSQTPYDYPYAQDSINLVKGAPDKATLPFDKPFYLIINPSAYKIDISRVTGVFVYKIKDKSGNRSLVKEDADIVFKLGSTYDTISGRLAINFPALKPSQDFDVSIHQTLNPLQRFILLSIINAFNSGDSKSAGEWYDKIKKDLTSPNEYCNRKRTSFKYRDENDYFNQKKAVLTPILTNISTAVFSSFSVGTAMQIKNAFAAADASKIQNDVLYLLNPKDLSVNDIAEGILPLSSSVGTKAEQFDVLTRLKNVTNSLAIVNQIKTALWQLNLRTNDVDVQALQLINDRNIANLKANQKLLSDLSNDVITQTDDGGDTYKAIWLIGSNKNYNLSTKGGTILSTQLGITNLTLRSNLNKIQNVQKLFTGINIFFRSVDRNLPLRQLKATSDKDDLSSRKTIFQHLALSVGLTFGDYDQADVDRKNFQNLFSGMSLLVGPSYRFAKAFCFSAGAALLKRTNPNPLITGTVTTAGFYSSLSIDFDFISTVSSVTVRALK